MAAYFFDSSALVKRFARETGTAWVINLLKPASGNRIYIARITYFEFITKLYCQIDKSSHILSVPPALNLNIRILL